MATVKFLYRSTQKKTPLTLRLFYTNKGKKIRLSQKTKEAVTKNFYNGDFKAKRISDLDRANYQKQVKQKLDKIELHILDAFYLADADNVNTAWLAKQIENFYNPPENNPDKQAPKHLTDFLLFYADIKQNDLSKNRVRRLGVIRKKLLRYEKHKSKKLLISKINDQFKKDFLEYGKAQNYAQNTLKTDFSVIKTVCTYAAQWNIKISPQLANLKIKTEAVKAPYLSFNELSKIKETDFPQGGYLDNARDWLLISCFTGQRVSDFMRFATEMISQKKGKTILEFTQKKTGKRIAIPFLKEANMVLKKNGGKFPRATTPERYNDYIKEVCKAAGINEPIKGKVLVCIADNEAKAERNDYRRELKTVPKYKLVSSHIGRRSFATNYYGKVPTNYLIKITGHSTEKMFLNYIQKTEDDTAFDAFKYFNDL